MTNTFPEPLNTLSSMQLLVLERYVETLHFDKGETIFLVGDEPNGCYIVDKGLVRIETENQSSDPDERDDVFAFLEEGSIMGELSLLDQLPRSASAFAHTDVSMRRISLEAFQQILSEFPPIGIDLVSALGRAASKKLRDTTRRLDNMINTKSDTVVDATIKRAEFAQQDFLQWSEEQVDALLLDLATTFASKAQEFAQIAVDDTHIGNVADKTLKNQVASMGVYESLVGKKGYGTLENNDTQLVDIASPIGIVFGLVPVTNPTSTFIFKTLIALKARNAVILSPHRRSLVACNAVGEMVKEVLAKHGAPEHIVQWIKERNSRKQIVTFMGHRKIGLVLATGGPSVVKAAYSSGNPAIGVGSGNAPTLICDDADLQHAAGSIIQSKSFDNGLICGSEHNLVALDGVYDAFINQLELQGAAVLTPEEVEQFRSCAIDPRKNIFKEAIIGKRASDIATICNISRPYTIRLIVVPSKVISPDNPFAREKMTPVLSLFRAINLDTSFLMCQELLDIDGTGHTAIIHTRDEETAKRFGIAMPVSRILVNSPGAQGVVGLTTHLVPSLTLGCGTFGHNSTTDNITYTHMMNVKRLAFYSPERVEALSNMV